MKFTKQERDNLTQRELLVWTNIYSQKMLCDTHPRSAVIQADEVIQKMRKFEEEK